MSYTIEGNKVSITSAITEETDLPHLSKIEGDVNIDLAKVTYINSFGVKNWCNWINGFSGLKISLDKCPFAFIQAINMVPEMLPSFVSVDSFEVPCVDAEEEEFEIILVRGEHFSGKVSSVDQIDFKDLLREGCEIDVLEDQYFNFLKS